MSTIKQQCEELRSLMIQCRNHINARNIAILLNREASNSEKESEDIGDNDKESD